MAAKESYKNVLLLISAVATAIATYIAYLAYSARPYTVMVVYEAKNNTEIFHSSGEVTIQPKNIQRDNGFLEFDLPFKISNEGDKDSEGIIAWVRAEGAELKIQNQDWSVGEYAEQQWCVTKIDRLRPHSWQKPALLRGRIKEGVREIRIYWQIIAYNAAPTEDVITLRFQLAWTSHAHCIRGTS